MLVNLKRLRGLWGRDANLEQQVTDYRVVFGSEPARRSVLPDLAEFCGAAYPAPDIHMERAAGRRDVWLRIQNHLNLTDQQLYALLKGEPFLNQE